MTALIRPLTDDEARLAVRLVIWAVVIVMVWPLVDQLSALLAIWVRAATDPLAGIR